MARARVAAILVLATLPVLAGCGSTDPSTDGRPAAAATGTADPGADSADRAAYADDGAWASDGRAAIGTHRASWERLSGTPGDRPTQLVQTSAGVVLVGSRLTDDGAEDVRSLLRPDGTTTPLHLPDGAFPIAGDPSAPRIAWLEVAEARLVVRVWDVVRDRELASVSVPGPPRGSPTGQSPFRTAILDGDDAYAASEQQGAYRVRWRTGERERIDLTPVSVRAGRAVAQVSGRPSVVDPATGRVLRALPRDAADARLSPDGRHVLFTSHYPARPSATVVDVATGESVRLPGVGGAEGVGGIAEWTTGGRVLTNVTGRSDAVQSCDVAGECRRRTLGVDDGIAPHLADYWVPG